MYVCSEGDWGIGGGLEGLVPLAWVFLGKHRDDTYLPVSIAAVRAPRRRCVQRVIYLFLSTESLGAAVFVLERLVTNHRSLVYHFPDIGR